MTILMIACSKRAFTTMKQIEAQWSRQNPQDHIHCIVKCKSLEEISQKQSLTECVGEWFGKVDALLFISAVGIAVRSIAPFLEHKSIDPAVLVMDETAKFCVSLLSGHAGGANELTNRMAEQMGAVPVITTATDREGKFAVDDFARRNGLVVTDWKMAKRFSASILEGGSVGFLSEIPISGQLPKELICRDITDCRDITSYKDITSKGVTEEEKRTEKGVLISYKEWKNLPFTETLQLIPKTIIAGIGCRKGTSEEKIAKAIETCCQAEKIRKESLASVASIDLKKEETGILSYCKKQGIQFLTYPAEELRQLEGEFSESEFVAKITGVSNVCERSAWLASGGNLLSRKRVCDGVTVALAEKKGSMEF